MKKTSHRKTAGLLNRREDYDALYDAILQLKTRDECYRFFHDLYTPAEAVAFAERWRVACMLNEKKLSYREIHARTNVSVTTIGRVARFLEQEPYQGYALVMKRLADKKKQSR